VKILESLMKTRMSRNGIREEENSSESWMLGSMELRMLWKLDRWDSLPWKRMKMSSM
jgi:hypothetical protein